MISFVVDKLPSHYYQAELLLHSLEQNTSYTKENIVVQCLNRVDAKFINHLKDNGYTYNIITPYLDGKYCNKLQQLEYFINKNIDGVILMDTDMFVVSDLVDIKGNNIIAKRVDAPNPTLVTLENIYKKASLKTPCVVKSDWDMPKNETLENNFNGGFYYIPKHLIATMSREWKRWGEWLYAQPELFEKKSQFIHVDQVSFSLAVHSNSFTYAELSANYNFPIHSSLKITSFEDTKEIKIIHYHREIDDFGLLNSSNISDIKAQIAIEKVNSSISHKNSMMFYQDYKKSQLSYFNFSDKVVRFEKKLQSLTDGHKLNLHLHAGTPKTGTTSLQHLLAQNSDALRKNGFLYPSNFIVSPEPKHQWIVSTLMADDFDAFYEHISYAFNEARRDNLQNIILSTEGIYNHWWDYSPEAKAIFKTLSNYFNTSVIVFFRDQEGFANTLYKQYIKNPQNSVSCYGKDLSFEDMMTNKWFLKHLDYLGFIYDTEHIFTKQNLKIFAYSQDIVKDFCEELGIDVEYSKGTKQNKGLSHIAIEMLRVVNRYNLSLEDKSEILKELSHCDEILKKYSKEKIDFLNIKNKFILQDEILKEEYQFFFSSSSKSSSVLEQ